ncbi:MAG: HEPN domain-containing protein [Candidatus Kuenenbacteria bacterium]
MELLLKGKVVEAAKKEFPITHNIIDLARKANLQFTVNQEKNIRIINTFNIAGRYDDYKFSFHKKATASYTEKYYQKTKNLILWLKKR